MVKEELSPITKDLQKVGLETVDQIVEKFNSIKKILKSKYGRINTCNDSDLTKIVSNLDGIYNSLSSYTSTYREIIQDANNRISRDLYLSIQEKSKSNTIRPSEELKIGNYSKENISRIKDVLQLSIGDMIGLLEDLKKSVESLKTIRERKSLGDNELYSVLQQRYIRSLFVSKFYNKFDGYTQYTEKLKKYIAEICNEEGDSLNNEEKEKLDNALFSLSLLDFGGTESIDAETLEKLYVENDHPFFGDEELKILAPSLIDYEMDMTKWKENNKISKYDDKKFYKWIDSLFGRNNRISDTYHFSKSFKSKIYSVLRKFPDENTAERISSLDGSEEMFANIDFRTFISKLSWTYIKNLEMLGKLETIPKNVRQAAWKIRTRILNDANTERFNDIVKKYGLDNTLILGEDSIEGWHELQDYQKNLFKRINQDLAVIKSYKKWMILPKS